MTDGDPRAGDHPGDRGGERFVRLVARVDGHVQGVGFRAWVRHRATELGLSGSATNLTDGSVEVVAEGTENACRRLLAALESGTTPGRVTSVQHHWGQADGRCSGFVEQ